MCGEAKERNTGQRERRESIIASERNPGKDI